MSGTDDYSIPCDDCKKPPSDIRTDIQMPGFSEGVTLAAWLCYDCYTSWLVRRSEAEA